MSDAGRLQTVNGLSLYVEDIGAGDPVLLVHGWPDSARVWRHQVPFLAANGFRVLTLDQRGFGRSERPDNVGSFALTNAVADLVQILDNADVPCAHLVGHDFGAAVAWLMATLHPDRVDRLVVLSVPHPFAPRTMRQHEMSWYQLLFQFEGIAEATIQADDWTWFRAFTRGDGDLEQNIADLSRPGALTASLNWYRANLAPRMPGRRPDLPPVQAPTLGVWSTRDHYLDGERMAGSAAFVAGPWRYEQIEDASHWLQLDAPDTVNRLLLEWLQPASH